MVLFDDAADRVKQRFLAQSENDGDRIIVQALPLKQARDLVIVGDRPEGATFGGDRSDKGAIGADPLAQGVLVILVARQVLTIFAKDGDGIIGGQGQ